MNFTGFNVTNEDTGIVIELEMPQRLSKYFFARLYAKGKMNDEAAGDPEAVWRVLGKRYRDVPLVAPLQVHGTNIIEADKDNSLPLRPEADGVLVTEHSSAFASLRFADCVPVVIAGISEKPWLYLLHSGFKGTLQNIAAAALAEAEQRNRLFNKGNIWAWICPAIGAECYSRRKDDPSAVKASNAFSAENVFEEDEYFRFDLKGEIASQISAFGVPKDNIYTFDCCTSCCRDYFYSYRAGDAEKRIFLLAGMPKTKS